MSWHHAALAGLDLETTGTDPETARVVTACIGRLGEQSWTAGNWLLRQDAPIPEGAIAVHGITTEFANTHGEDPKAALAAIAGEIYAHWASGHPLVVFNAPYDLTVLDRCLSREGLGNLDVRGPVIDPRVIDKQFDKYRKGKRTLTDMCAHYGIAFSAHEAHGAEADTKAACLLARQLSHLATGDGRTTVGDLDFDDLHRSQATWYRDNTNDFAAWAKRQGRPLQDANTAWPIR